MKKNPEPSWSDIKGRLSGFDTAGLIGLVKDLYEANKDNRAFLHARFNIGDDILKPYKTVIDRWVYPDFLKNQATSVANAKKAISAYKRAGGRPEGSAELMVYCERVASFCDDVGFEDDAFFAAFVRMYEQALISVCALSPADRDGLSARLDAVRLVCDSFGYGVGDEVQALFAEYLSDER